MESNLLYVNGMGLYVRKTNNDYKISQFLGDIEDARLYGKTVFVNENPKTGEEFVYYVNDNHYKYPQNNEFDYDFEVGLDEDGHPYLDFIFYNLDGFKGHVYVETDFGKKRKNHGKGRRICFWLKNSVNSELNYDAEGFTWMDTKNIQLNKTYRFYICFIKNGACAEGPKYLRRYFKKFDYERPADWIVHLNVRLGFAGGFVNSDDSMRYNDQIMNFKNYKTISYGINDEYEL